MVGLDVRNKFKFVITAFVSKIVILKMVKVDSTSSTTLRGRRDTKGSQIVILKINEQTTTISMKHKTSRSILSYRKNNCLLQ